MEPVELRPLSLGELLDRTFTLYRSRFWLFAGIMAIPAAFSVPVNVIYLSARANAVFTPAGPAGFTPVNVLLLLLFGLFLFSVYVLAFGAATSAVAESYLGRDATVRSSYGSVRGKFWKMIGVGLSVTLLVLGMLIVASLAVFTVVAGAGALLRFSTGNSAAAIVVGTIIVVGIIAAYVFAAAFALRYSVSIPALLLENLGVFAAVRRSAQLTRGRRWHLFLALLLAVILAYVGIIVFQGPFLVAVLFYARSGFLPPWLAFASSVAGAIGGTITGPLLMIVLVLCYYDSRIRKEGFDLQHMMSTLDQPAAAAGTATPA